MGTHSHFLMTWAIKRRRDQVGKATNGLAFLLGSFMPDVPLTIFTVGWIGYWYFFTDRSEFFFGQAYDDIYFTNPLMIAGHNIFHAPFPIALMIGLGYWMMQKKQRWGSSLFWFGLACGFHSIIDILTHHNDGPLLLWPFDWTTRFSSPVSYWHPDYYGNLFGRFELGLDILIILWLIATWWTTRRARRASLSMQH